MLKPSAAVFKQKGQAVILILFILVIIMTLALSSMGQMLGDIQISQEEQESIRAFTLAEAGIEAGLGTFSGGVWTDEETGESYTVSVAEEGAGSGQLVSAEPVKKGDVIELQVNEDEPINLYWQGDGAQMEIIVLKLAEIDFEVEQEDPPEIVTLTNDEYRLKRYLQSGGGSETLTGEDGQEYEFQNRYTLTDANMEAARVVRLRPLSQDSYIGVTSDNLPNQRYRITATGTTPSGTSRKIEVTRDKYRFLPSIFDYVLFSGSSIGKS